MEKHKKAVQFTEAFYLVFGLVMFAAGAYARDWTFTIVVGLGLLGSGLVYQWRKPETIVLPPPKVVDKPTRRQHFKANGGSHTANEWRMLCEMHNWCCAACGRKRPLTKDHIVPVTEGGSDDISNIQPLCRPCNSQKNNRTMDFS